MGCVPISSKPGLYPDRVLLLHLALGQIPEQIFIFDSWLNKLFVKDKDLTPYFPFSLIGFSFFQVGQGINHY